MPLSIVVVDNTPNDPMLQDALEPYPDTTLIRAPENLGFGRGNNLGIQWALHNSDCEFIFVFNNDATLQRDAIEKLQGILDEHPSIGLATGRIVLSGRSDILWYGGGIIDWRRGGGRIPGFNGKSNTELALRSREVDFVSGCAMFIRRSVVESVGGFDPVFFMYEEDLDLSLRIREAGYRLYYCADAVFSHRVQGSQRDREAPLISKWSPMNPNYSFHVFHMVRNSIINMRKHASANHIVDGCVKYPLFLLYKSFRAARVLGFKAFDPVFKGVKSGLTLSLQERHRCHHSISVDKA
jgi:GT2 family glycosyltransferase